MARRIRTVKPEFWESEDVAAIQTSVVYDGPMPASTNAIAPMSDWCEYVYLLFDAADELVYVGRSFRPADRFTKHRRKPWWVHVTSVAIIRVEELPRWQRGPGQKVGPNTARLEAIAIDRLRPWANVAAPAREVMR